MNAHATRWVGDLAVRLDCESGWAGTVRWEIDGPTIVAECECGDTVLLVTDPHEVAEARDWLELDECVPRPDVLARANGCLDGFEADHWRASL